MIRRLIILLLEQLRGWLWRLRLAQAKRSAEEANAAVRAPVPPAADPADETRKALDDFARG